VHRRAVVAGSEDQATAARPDLHFTGSQANKGGSYVNVRILESGIDVGSCPWQAETRAILRIWLTIFRGKAPGRLPGPAQRAGLSGIIL